MAPLSIASRPLIHTGGHTHKTEVDEEKVVSSSVPVQKNACESICGSWKTFSSGATGEWKHICSALMRCCSGGVVGWLGVQLLGEKREAVRNAVMGDNVVAYPVPPPAPHTRSKPTRQGLINAEQMCFHSPVAPEENVFQLPQIDSQAFFWTGTELETTFSSSTSVLCVCPPVWMRGRLAIDNGAILLDTQLQLDPNL
jgi:hypothetical protein